MVQVIARAENHEPKGEKWQFDEDVAKSFDIMLVNSVPGYSDMRKWVHSLAVSHLSPIILQGAIDGGVLEIGSSRGESLVPLHNEFLTSKFMLPMTAVEVSEPMNKLLAEALPSARILDWDLTRRHEDLTNLQSTSRHVARFDLVLSILTLMFIPIERRQDVLHSLFNSMRSGAMFILVEKTVGSNAFSDKMLVHNYYEFKHANGYTRENIERKRLSLEGVLVPCKAEWNEDLLKSAGFVNIQPFWRALQFCGWVAFKP